MADNGDLWLPTEFPYEYASLHTHGDPELTRHSPLNTAAQKSPSLFASPESTLNRVASRPFLALRNDGALDFNHRSRPLHPSLFIKPPHRCFYTTLQPHHNNNIKHARIIMRPQHQMGNNGEIPLQFQNCFTPIRPQIYTEFLQKPNFVSGPHYHYNGVKKSRCAGTGVFLPRNPTESRKKTGQVGRGRVSQPLERNTIPMVTHLQPRARSCFKGGFSPKYDNYVYKQKNDV